MVKLVRSMVKPTHSKVKFAHSLVKPTHSIGQLSVRVAQLVLSFAFWGGFVRKANADEVIRLVVFNADF